MLNLLYAYTNRCILVHIILCNRKVSCLVLLPFRMSDWKRCSNYILHLMPKGMLIILIFNLFTFVSQKNPCQDPLIMEYTECAFIKGRWWKVPNPESQSIKKKKFIFSSNPRSQLTHFCQSQSHFWQSQLITDQPQIPVNFKKPNPSSWLILRGNPNSRLTAINAPL